MDDLPVEVQLKEAVRAVEACIAGDIDALSGRAQQEAVVALQRLQSLVSAAHAKAVSPWDASAVWADDRSRSGPARLARDAACAPASARRVVRRARALRSMPLTRAAFEDGSLSADHVDVLCRANHAPLEALFARDEAVLVGHARTMHYDDLVRLVDHWRNCADDAAAEDRAARAHAERYAKAAKTLGGEVDLRARLDPIGGAVVSNELERLERELFEADWAAAREVHGDAVRLEHLARTGPQRHADALILMATRSAHLPADATPARVLVTVLVDLDTFTTALRYARGEAAAAQVSSSRPRRTTPAERAEDRVCELSDGTVLTPGQVAAWLADADVERIVFGPGSRVVDVAIRTRCFTGATRRAVEVRDRHCTFPGCRVPAERCHVDHIVEYSDGGLTVQDNGRLLCPAHNRQRLGRSSPPADGP